MGLILDCGKQDGVFLLTILFFVYSCALSCLRTLPTVSSPQSQSDPSMAWEQMCKQLQGLGIRWKKLPNYSMRCRWDPGEGKAALTHADGGGPGGLLRSCGSGASNEGSEGCSFFAGTEASSLMEEAEGEERREQAPAGGRVVRVDMQVRGYQRYSAELCFNGVVYLGPLSVCAAPCAGHILAWAMRALMGAAGWVSWHFLPQKTSPRAHSSVPVAPLLPQSDSLISFGLLPISIFILQLMKVREDKYQWDIQQVGGPPMLFFELCTTLLGLEGGQATAVH